MRCCCSVRTVSRVTATVRNISIRRLQGTRVQDRWHAPPSVTQPQRFSRRDLLRMGKLASSGVASPTGLPSFGRILFSVKAQGFEGLVAKRLHSGYEAGLRSGAWQKMRVNRGQVVRDWRLHRAAVSRSQNHRVERLRSGRSVRHRRVQRKTSRADSAQSARRTSTCDYDRGAKMPGRGWIDSGEWIPVLRASVVTPWIEALALWPWSLTLPLRFTLNDVGWQTSRGSRSPGVPVGIMDQLASRPVDVVAGDIRLPHA
jgi:hypothetical protein